jgi:hypothetical protein
MKMQKNKKNIITTKKKKATQKKPLSNYKQHYTLAHHCFIFGLKPTKTTTR